MWRTRGGGGAHKHCTGQAAILTSEHCPPQHKVLLNFCVSGARAAAVPCWHRRGCPCDQCLRARALRLALQAVPAFRERIQPPPRAVAHARSNWLPVVQLQQPLKTLRPMQHQLKQAAATLVLRPPPLPPPLPAGASRLLLRVPLCNAAHAAGFVPHYDPRACSPHLDRRPQGAAAGWRPAGRSAPQAGSGSAGAPPQERGCAAAGRPAHRHLQGAWPGAQAVYQPHAGWTG